ncbi:TorD/DmsD family molecular chaperone [Ramlibacter sp.]|uniref:TorD/DmsD family molecular chaperone n=1 Tax=Ramlibacter sp. TaxID=1917967 RepID=UPI002FCC2599
MSEALPVSSALDEETARAEVYGLLAQLWYAPPGADLLARLQVAVTEAPAAGAFLEEPWRTFVGVARETTAAQAAAEYDALFGGVGKPECYLFGSHYLAGFLNERPLARLRDDLGALGLTRDEMTMPETEDHVAYLCEVMRYLIAGDDPPPAGDSPAQRSGTADGEAAVANLARQRDFFAAHLQPWVGEMCHAVAAHPSARLYAALAGFSQAFFQVEQQGFDLLA